MVEKTNKNFTHIHAYTHDCTVCVHKDMYEGRSKSSKTHSEGSAKAEHFCFGNTLPLIKLEKSELVFSSFIRNDNLLPWQKCSDMVLFPG